MPETTWNVHPGEQVERIARTHRLSGIDVAPGGSIIIPAGSSRWAIWWVDGDGNIDGDVTGRGFAASAGTVTDKTPDGRSISHTFEAGARGGFGGSAGNSMTGGQSSAGGGGAAGTSEFGGGGGSAGGVFIQGPSSHVGSSGRDATDWRGAAPAANGGYDYVGGDGGRADRFRNGALLLIFCRRFSGAGLIDLSGVDGLSGSPGSRGWQSNRGRRGGGGGGGGAPGGDGGHLVVIAEHFEHELRVLGTGGKGGVGGPAGEPRNGAIAGRAGDSGALAVYDEIPLED